MARDFKRKKVTFFRHGMGSTIARQTNRLGNRLCNFLTELHVDHQNLERDQNVVFDPRTCVGLSARLHVLNTSNNKMVDLAPLNELQGLQSLNVAENHLSDLQSTIEILAQMQSLQSFDLRGNPLTKQLRYREHVIVSAHNCMLCTSITSIANLELVRL